MLILNAELRKDTDKIPAIRKDKKIPAALYGPNSKAEALTIDYEAFRKTIQQARLHTVFELNIDGKSQKVLIKDYSKDPVKNSYTHVDFYAIDNKKAVKVPVPVEFTGTSPALRVGAILSVATPTIKVKCLPQNIPSNIEVDISTLRTDGDKIRISELSEMKDIEILLPSEAMIAKAELSRAGKKAANEAAAEGSKATVEATTE